MTDIGVDIGGTFTDVVCRRPDKPLHVLKVPTSRADPSKAVLEAVGRLKDEAGIDPGAIARFVHGTTVATNAVLERRGPRTGLLTTEGFKDILEIGRQMRQTVYAVLLKPEVPAFLAPGAFRQEVRERLSSTGEVVTPLDEASVEEAADRLVAMGVQGIAVCFLFSFLNPAHERRAAEIIRARHPGLFVSLSSDVDPAFREYERTVVTTLDAYIKPVVDAYLSRLEEGLGTGGVEAPLQIMQSRGGIARAAVVRRRPVRLFLSGPAAGVIGAQMTGEQEGIRDIISVDIGGTSSDIALIRDGKPLIRPEGLVAGYQVRVPMVDVNAIGSGGGSLAWIDGAGGLRVGPQSAGSDPGPACYGWGGEEPTVTDASIVLGYIDPAYFAGGRLTLRPELAHAAVEEKIAKPLGLTVTEAALGIHRVVAAQMAEGIRLVSIRQGFDPRDFTLLPLGGSGGIHACALAEELKIGRILLARHPGVLSAIGMLSAPIEHEAAIACPKELASLDIREIRAVLAELDRNCSALMAQEGVGEGDVQISYFADVCYIGQSHYLEIPFTPSGDVAGQLARGFRKAHHRVFGHSTDAPARIVNLRAIHRVAAPQHDGIATAAPAAAAPVKGTRAVHLINREGAVPATVYAREQLRANMVMDGPAIIEQDDSTTVVYPGWTISVLPSGSILLSRA